MNYSFSHFGLHGSDSIINTVLKDNIGLCPDTSSLSQTMKDLVLFQSHSKCWPPEFLQSVIFSLNIAKSINLDLIEKGARVQFFMIPPGWAFPNQNTLGRTLGDYSIQTGTVLDYSGLLEFAKDFVSIDDLTPVFYPHSTSDDNLYFSVDGHLTEFGHTILASYLYDNYFSK